MRASALWCACLTLVTAASAASTGDMVRKRDASTVMSGGTNNEGEDHGALQVPQGSRITDLHVGTAGEQIAAYWSATTKNDVAKQAYIMIHGKLRDGDTYWTTMNNILQTAVRANDANADPNAIVVAPQFFSARYNSGQYAENELAWGDVNAWQAGDVAVQPNTTKLTSFDALDALVQHFLNGTQYPAMERIVVVGHGGGGQLAQRYATVAKTPTNNPRNVHIRYIHGDPSSCAYFTDDRPTIQGTSLPAKASCPTYNTWRYGFDNFTGTSADGLKTPQQYFQQYTSRDVISIVGYQDVDASGDEYCMAAMQGGTKRRDRNLVWWQYINLLAKTGEDLTGFPATFSNLPDWSNLTNRVFGVRLVVVEDADHNAEEVFESDVGRAALFAAPYDVLPTGWRPDGWKNTTNAVAPTYTVANGRTANGTRQDDKNAKPSGTTSSAAPSILYSTTTTPYLALATCFAALLSLHIIVL